MTTAIEKTFTHPLNFNRHPLIHGDQRILGRDIILTFSLVDKNPTVRTEVKDFSIPADADTELNEKEIQSILEEKNVYNKLFKMDDFDPEVRYLINLVIKSSLSNDIQKITISEILRQMCINDVTLKRNFPPGYLFRSIGGLSEAKPRLESGYDLYGYVRIFNEDKVFLTSYNTIKEKKHTLPFVKINNGRVFTEVVGEIMYKRFGIDLNNDNLLPVGVFRGKNEKQCLNFLYSYSATDDEIKNMVNGEFYKWDNIPSTIIPAASQMLQSQQQGFIIEEIR